MDNRQADARSRDLNQMSVPGLSDEARKAVNAAFDVMSTWRAETASHSAKAIETMAQAARALGWPEQVVDATRTQVESITKMQTQMMDRMMDAWEEQIKSPKGMTGFPSEMMSRLRSMPGFGSDGGAPNVDAFNSMLMNPLQFWMQLGQQWQKTWTDAMTAWTKGGPLGELHRR